MLFPPNFPHSLQRMPMVGIKNFGNQVWQLEDSADRFSKAIKIKNLTPNEEKIHIETEHDHDPEDQDCARNNDFSD